MDIEGLKKRLREGAHFYHAPTTWNEAADAIESLQRENAIFCAERNQARAQREFCTKILTRIHSFISPADVTLPDGQRFEFNNPAIEHDMLKALSAAIRAVPDELEKAKNAQPEDELHGY